MGKRSRTKGHDFERWVAGALRVVFPGAMRQLEVQMDQAQGVDLRGTGHYRIQCKKHKAYAPITAIQEIQCQRELGDVPVLVTAGDRQEPMAVIPFSDFLDFVKRLDGKKDPGDSSPL